MLDEFITLCNDAYRNLLHTNATDQILINFGALLLQFQPMKLAVVNAVHFDCLPLLCILDCLQLNMFHMICCYTIQISQAGSPFNMCSGICPMKTSKKNSFFMLLVGHTEVDSDKYCFSLCLFLSCDSKQLEAVSL
jgi:hypothetical protein